MRVHRERTAFLSAITDVAPSAVHAAPPVDTPTGAERRWLVGLAFLHALLAGVAFLVLGSVFDFPEILREPAAVVLARFAENRTTIRAAYYAFAMSSAVLVPIADLLGRAFARSGVGGGALSVATALGLLTGLTQLLGFIRWVILVPFLADAYADPAAGPGTRDAVEIAYGFANRYLGMTIGEHLGWVFQGTWLLVLGVALLDRGGAGRWFGSIGFGTAVLILASSLEQFEFGFGGPLGLANTIGTTAFPFWLIAVTVWLLRRRGDAA